MLPTSTLSAIRWLPLVNQSSSTIPAFACLRVVSTALDATGQLIYTVDQPNGDASANYLFNGPSAVAAGAGGSGTLDFPCQAIWDTSTPSPGDSWGPKSGQWTLTKGGLPGFPVLGIVDSGTSRMLIGSSPAAAIIVKPAYDIAPISSATPGSGSGEVYSFNGTTVADQARTVTVYNLSTQTAKGGTFYEAIFVGGYAFVVNPGTSPTLFEATIYGTALTSSAATCEVTPTTAIWGALPDSSLYPITVQNDFGLQGPIGRKGLVAQADAGTYYLIQIQPPSDVLFEGTLVGTLATTDATTSVNVTGPAIYGGLPGGGGGIVTARNDFQMAGSASQVVLVAEDILGNYYLIPTTSQPLPILFWTTLSANLVSTATTASCNAGVTAIYGTLAAAGFTAANNLKLAAPANSVALVAGDATTTGGIPTPNYFLLATKPAAGGAGCTFTLQGDLSSGSASATVGTQIWGTIPNVAGDTVTVNDFQGLFARALGATSAIEAALGEAVYDSSLGYIVVACDQETLRYRGNLAGALTVGTTSVQVNSLDAMNAKPFGQTTSDAYLTAINTLGLAAASDSECYVEWDEANAQWELTEVELLLPLEIEGSVYSNFTKTTSQFLMQVSRAYQGYDGSTPAYGASITVLNYVRNVPDASGNPYLFQGVVGGCVSAVVDVDQTIITGSPVYRARWVECPPNDQPVQAGSSGGSYSSASPSSPAMGGDTASVGATSGYAG